MAKVKISTIDFLPLSGKISIGKKDQDGKELFLGDTVTTGGDNPRMDDYLVGYRYGDFVKLPMIPSCYMSLDDTTNLRKKNQITAAMQNLIIGDKSEQFFVENKEILATLVE